MRHDVKNRTDSFHIDVSDKVVTGKFTYYVDLIIHFVKRDFVLRYEGSALGFLWSILLPMAHLFILVFIFGTVIPLGIEDYAVYIFTSILPWTWFSTCISGAGYIFTGNRDLMRRPNFTPSILIIVQTMSNLLTYLILLPLLIVVLITYNRELTWYLLLFPLLILIQSILIVGLSILIATLNVFYRDVQHMASVAVMLLFYVTPIFYRIQGIGDKYKILFKLNPVATLIQGYQAIFFYGRAPDWSALLIAGISSIAICIVGYIIYQKQVHDIIDTV